MSGRRWSLVWRWHDDGHEERPEVAYHGYPAMTDTDEVPVVLVTHADLAAEQAERLVGWLNLLSPDGVLPTAPEAGDNHLGPYPHGDFLLQADELDLPEWVKDRLVMARLTGTNYRYRVSALERANEVLAGRNWRVERNPLADVADADGDVWRMARTLYVLERDYALRVAQVWEGDVLLIGTPRQSPAPASPAEGGESDGRD